MYTDHDFFKNASVILSFDCGSSDSNARFLVSDEKSRAQKPWQRVSGPGSSSAAEQQARTRFRSQPWPSEESAAAPGK